jgi:hypothetical protein
MGSQNNQKPSEETIVASTPSATSATLPQQTAAAPAQEKPDDSRAEIERLKREAEAAEAARKDAESLAAAERSKREEIERAAKEAAARRDASTYSYASTSVKWAPIPGSFSIGAANDALGGNTKRLTNAFVFSQTPQGHKYWWTIYEGGGPLPPEAAAQLRDWVKRYNSGEKPGSK